ncbi:MAG: hypothetical protein JW822_08835 [Spirochaetales bacterium]|nr:hypothetical protein [Spirochaetales bacterium]
MRNSFLQAFFYAAVSFSVFFVVIIVLLFSQQPLFEMSKNAQAHLFWFVYEYNAPASFWDELGIVIMYLISFIAFFRFKVLFKKTGSSELFFLGLFIFSLLFEVFRCGSFLVQHFAWPETLNIFFIRTVYFGRFFGLFAVFFSSLYALQLDYQKYNILIGIIALVSFALAISVSFKNNILLSNGLFKLGDEQGLFILLSALKLFTILTFVVAAFRRDLAMLIPAVCFLLIGRELLLFAPGLFFLILGSLLLVGGIILTNIKIKAVYYWI